MSLCIARGLPSGARNMPIHLPAQPFDHRARIALAARPLHPLPSAADSIPQAIGDENQWRVFPHGGPSDPQTPEAYFYPPLTVISTASLDAAAPLFAKPLQPHGGNSSHLAFVTCDTPHILRPICLGQVVSLPWQCCLRRAARTMRSCRPSAGAMPYSSRSRFFADLLCTSLTTCTPPPSLLLDVAEVHE